MTLAERIERLEQVVVELANRVYDHPDSYYSPYSYFSDALKELADDVAEATKEMY